jgi:hypothetical protein
MEVQSNTNEIQAAILPKPSGLVRSVLPFSSQAYTEVVIQILPSWTPGTSSPLYGVLEIGRRDAWKTLGRGEGRELTVLEAYVKGKVLLQGTRRVVGRYPNLAGLFSSATFFVTSGLGLMFCFYRFAAPFDGRVPRGGAGAGMKALKGMGMGAGVPIPPAGIPKTLEGRPRRRSQGSASTPRAYVKREASLSFSESSVSTFPFAYSNDCSCPAFCRRVVTCQRSQRPSRVFCGVEALLLSLMLRMMMRGLPRYDLTGYPI